MDSFVVSSGVCTLLTLVMMESICGEMILKSTLHCGTKRGGSSDKMDDDDDDFNVKNWATLHDAALEVLSTPSAHKKALLTQVIAKKWFDGTSILKARDISSGGKLVADTPERDALVTIVSSNSNKLKLGSGRSIESRRKILHSLSHIESWAIDLSWDIIARFGHEGEKE